MKVKALRYKKEFNIFQEFIHIQEFGGEPMLFTSALPRIQPETAVLEDMRKSIENDDYFEGIELNWNELELVEFELVEKNTIGADIRNKLSPCLNLVSMLELYFADSVAHATEKRAKLYQLIQTEMKKSKETIKYIANLL